MSLGVMSSCLPHRLSVAHFTRPTCLCALAPQHTCADMRVAVSAALQRHGGLELERCMSTRALDAATAGGEEPGASSTRTAARAGDLGRYVEQVQRTFLEADSGATGSHSAQQRLWALEQLSGVLKRTTTPTECNLRILQFLAVHAFFSVSNVEAAQQVRRSFATRASHSLW